MMRRGTVYVVMLVLELVDEYRTNPTMSFDM